MILTITMIWWIQKRKELGFKAPKDIETAIAQQENSVSLIISNATKLKHALTECDKALEDAKQELKITKDAIEEVKSDLTKNMINMMR